MNRHSTAALVMAATFALPLALGLAAARDSAPRAIVKNAADPTLQWTPCPPLFATGCQIAVLQGDPARPHADVFFRVPAGYTIAAHSHSSAEHLVLVSGELEVQYAGQPAQRLKVGDFAYGPPQRPHTGRCLSRVPCTLYIAFETPVDAMEHTGPL